jgi:PKD repeat protein
MFRIRASIPVVLGLLGATLVGLATPAGAVSVTQPNIVSAVPADYTPDANDGIVYAINQVGNTVYMGGTFTSLSPHGSSTTVTANYIAAFTSGTGALVSSFAPTLNAQVESIIPGPAANEVYVAGDFTTVDGQSVPHIALLNTSDGSLVSSWKPSSINGIVQKIVYADGMLFAGGSFTKVGGVAHNALVALNPTTGKVLTYANLSFTGHHNWNVNCTAGNNCAGGTVGIKDMDIDPSGTHLVAIGDFTSVSDGTTTQHDDQFAMIDLGATSATVDTNFNTAAYSAACFASAFDSYVRGVEFSPDGKYFVVVATGGSGTNTDGTNSSCDTAARFETNATGTDVRPTWIDYTGQDTLLSVAITGGVVYVGGHQRWLNNSHGFDYAGAGAVPRPGLAALNPLSGVPFSWNPGRNPRGAGTFALFASPTGLYEGSDTNWIGNNQYQRKKIAFFPLANGEAYPDESTPSLPGRVYTAGGFANTANSNVLYRVDAAGPTIGAIDNGPDWQGDQSDPSPYHNGQSNVAGYSSISSACTNGPTNGPGPCLDSTVPASTPSAIFNNERWSPSDNPNMHWAFAVPAGDTVDVRLYFANRYSGTSQVGQRVFNVNVDGQPFLNHFDIVQAAGGSNIGTMRAATVTSDGQITVDFSHVTENPLIDGIEIVKDSGPTNFTNPVPIYRVHAGGSEINSTDSSPADWIGDGSDTVDGSSTTAASATPFRSGGNIAGWDNPWGGTRGASLPASAPSALFTTERWAPQTYTFPVAPGTPINVELFFANNCTCTNTAGAREFNVSIDGQQVMTNYDIVADVGDRTGEMKSFPATAPASGVVTVALTNGNADNAVINGLEIDQTAATPTGGPSGDIDAISYRHFDGTTSDTPTNLSTGISWGSIRGAFMVNGELIYGKNDGNLYERSFNGSTFGDEVELQPFNDPTWDNVDTGSGNTYQGQPSTLSGELSSVTSMFFTNSRLYYTLKGDSVMHWRWFEPESGIVGSDEFTVSDGNDWSNVAGAFMSPDPNANDGSGTLYYADRTTGNLESIAWNGTQATGSPSLADGTQNWASRGMFMLADATNPNQKPVADFTASCSATNNSCTFDPTASLDPDGSITDYGWDFGDSTGEHHPDSELVTHNFPSSGHFSVTLTVTDNDGATGTKTENVLVGATTPVPTFEGATSSCTSGTSACGASTTTSVPVPSTTASGDTLLLFVSKVNVNTAETVPAGWHQLDTEADGTPLGSAVYYRAATNGDVGGTVSVTFASKVRNSVILADYNGADPNTIEAYAKSWDSSKKAHVTPTAPVTVDGSLPVSYWTDKSSSTSAWTLPAGVNLDASQYDSGTAFDTAVLADPGATVHTGSYGGLSASTNAADGKANAWTIILAPAGTTTPPNSPPTAAFTSNCTNLHCDFTNTSSDSDGTIASSSWDFGDTVGTSTDTSPSYDYTAGGTYQVTLTVTDNQGAHTSITHPVMVAPVGKAISWVGSDQYDGNAASGSVTIPSGATAGDTLLLFASDASTATAPVLPAGWTQVGTTAHSNLSTAVYEKTVAAGDAGTPVSVSFGTKVQGSLLLSAYHNAVGSPIEASATNNSTGTSHTSPALTGLTAGSWVVSYWTDKSTGSTASWTAPAGVTQRATAVGSGTGVNGGLLADSGGPVSGSYAGQTATSTQSSGSATQWSIALTAAS